MKVNIEQTQFFERLDTVLIVKEMQLHDKDYLLHYFRRSSVAFEKVLRMVARHKVNEHIVSSRVVFGVGAPELSSLVNSLQPRVAFLYPL